MGYYDVGKAVDQQLAQCRRWSPDNVVSRQYNAVCDLSGECLAPHSGRQLAHSYCALLLVFRDVVLVKTKVT